jgi:hypothetical protein
MAKITVSIAEIVRILGANELISQSVEEIKTQGDRISFKLKTDWPALKHIRVGIGFVDFRDGNVILEIVTNRLVDRFDWLGRKLLNSLNLPDYVSHGEYPRIHVDINKLLARKIRGIRIDSIAFNEGQLYVTTCDG